VRGRGRGGGAGHRGVGTRLWPVAVLVATDTGGRVRMLRDAAAEGQLGEGLGGPLLVELHRLGD